MTETLLQIIRMRPSAAASCECCGAVIDEEDHRHLVNLATRRLLCVCTPCAMLFNHDGAGGSRFRAVPDRYVVLSNALDHNRSWRALDIPVGLAFLFRNGATKRVTAFYPGPAGATESELPVETWTDLVETEPALATLAPDVEALLVRPDAALIVPIDVCYELAGRIRRSWQGWQSGDAMQAEVDAFFSRAIARAGSVQP